MDWIRGFQKAINYIEDHITEPLDYDRIAQEMNISGSYFQKIFSILCGYTVGEYIRNRRLFLAGWELLTTDKKIIDIALKYGYDTPEGFTRAFTRFHGATPNAIRKRLSSLKHYSKLSITISVKGGSIMDYRIEKKKAFKIIAKSQRFDKLEDIQGRTDIPAFWMKCHSDGTVKYLTEQGKKDGVLGDNIVGICMDDPTKVKDFPYSIGAEFKGGEVPDGFKLIDIPEGEWIIFSSNGTMPETCHKLFHTIFAEFFPTSDYHPTGKCDMEVYPGNITSENYDFEIWINVEKNK